MTLPLTGLTVLDFTHLLPGELCSTILSDLGCEIIRIESVHPKLADQIPPIVKGESLYYWSIHRNKKTIAVDLKKPEGREIAHKLVQECDALVENFRPGVMKRLGLSYAEAKKLNSKVVYCSISGYGQESSFANRPGHDLNFLAESGILEATRVDGQHPVIPGALVSDYMSALYASLAVVAALFGQRATGKGKHVDISMFESALSTQQILATALRYLEVNKIEPQYRFPAELPHYAVYKCKDGKFIAIAPLESQFWQIFCEKTGLMDLAPPVLPMADSPLSQRLTETFEQKTQSEWLSIFSGADCCVSPVNSILEALDSLPAKERNVVTQLQHPTLGSIPQIASPMLTTEERLRVHDSVDSSDTAVVSVLERVGYDQSSIKRMRDEGTIKLRHAKL